MKIDKYLSKHLKADDLKSGPRLVSIASVEEASIGDDDKLVLHVEEFEQGIAPNKTGLMKLAEIFDSNDTDDWIGGLVVVYRDPDVMYQGKRTGGIAFRKPKEGTVKPEPVKETVSDDDLPF